MNPLGPFPSLGLAFQAIVRQALELGNANSGRELDNREIDLLAFELSDPRARIIDMPERHSNLPFLLAEVLWQLSARDDVAMLRHYAPKISRFSADGERFTGSAYGRRLFGTTSLTPISQWNQVLAILKQDPDTRRAILLLGLADESRLNSNRDYTCTTGLHLVIRNGNLNMIATMRSNDIMRGLQSDVFFFTILQEIAAAQLRIPMGTYTHVANLAQVFSDDLEWAGRCAQAEVVTSGTMRALPDRDIWGDLERLIAAEVLVRTQGLAAAPDIALLAWLQVLTSEGPDAWRSFLFDESNPTSGSTHGNS
jgi:thymidylate synthase